MPTFKTKKWFEKPGKTLWFGFALLTLSFSAFSWHAGREILPFDRHGDAYYPRTPYVSTGETAKTLWNEGTLERPEFYKIRDHFLNQSALEPGREIIQDVFSVAKDGRLFPKHPWLVSILAAPFYGLFGEAGFWIFQQLTLAALFWSLYHIAKSQAGARPAALLCVAAALGTNLFWFYSYDFSYDVLGAAFVLSGAALFRKTPWLAGLLLGLSLHIRITHLVLFPFIFWAWYPLNRTNLRFWFEAGVAILLAWVPLLVANYLIFGDAVGGPYAGVVIIVNGTMIPDLTSHTFALKYFIQEWYPRLVYSRDSLLLAYPVLILAPVSWILCRRHPARSFAWLLASAGLLHLFVHLTFYGWVGAGGARYVLPSALLMMIPLAFIPLKTRKNGGS